MNNLTISLLCASLLVLSCLAATPMSTESDEGCWRAVPMGNCCALHKNWYTKCGTVNCPGLVASPGDMSAADLDDRYFEGWDADEIASVCVQCVFYPATCDAAGTDCESYDYLNPIQNQCDRYTNPDGDFTCYLVEE